MFFKAILLPSMCMIIIYSWSGNIVFTQLRFLSLFPVNTSATIGLSFGFFIAAFMVLAFLGYFTYLKLRKKARTVPSPGNTSQQTPPDKMPLPDTTVIWTPEGLEFPQRGVNVPPPYSFSDTVPGYNDPQLPMVTVRLSVCLSF